MTKTLSELEGEFRSLFSRLDQLQREIRAKLEPYSGGKSLKGNELVGWLGEIYGAHLFSGRLVPDSEEHDFEAGGRRVSVKTRKGWSRGWKKSGAIPRIEGGDCPTHLLFVHLNDDYSIDRMWLFDWAELRTAHRFTVHIVREQVRSYIFTINESADECHVIYPKKLD